MEYYNNRNKNVEKNLFYKETTTALWAARMRLGIFSNHFRTFLNFFLLPSFKRIAKWHMFRGAAPICKFIQVAMLGANKYITSENSLNPNIFAINLDCVHRYNL